MLSGRKRIGVPLKSSLVKECGNVNLEVFLAENLEGNNSFNDKDEIYDVLATNPSL
jgi:hypothetical protein